VLDSHSICVYIKFRTTASFFYTPRLSQIIFYLSVMDSVQDRLFRDVNSRPGNKNDSINQAPNTTIKQSFEKNSQQQIKLLKHQQNQARLREIIKQKTNRRNNK